MLASIYRIENDLTKATQLFKQALDVNPKFLPALGNLGDICRITGHYPESLFYYEKIIQIEPSNVMAHFNMGIVFITLAQPGDAINQFRKVLQIQPNMPAAHSNMATALMDFGNIEEAISSYDKAIKIDPNLADAYHNMHAAVFDEDNLTPAIESLQSAIIANPKSHDSRAYLAMYMDLAGDVHGAEEHISFIEQHAPTVQYLLDGWKYVKSHMEQDTRLFSVTSEALKYSFSQSKIDGLVLEFGVRNGVSTNILAQLTTQEIHGFDSFEGLPEQWEGMPVGALSTFNKLPDVPDHVYLHAGWFEDTLPVFIGNHSAPVRFMNIDCDVYSSTKTIFDAFHDRIVAGTVIIFDEYISNPAWRDHEYKAFQEFIAETGMKYRYLLFSPYSKQAAVIITS